MDLDGVTSLKSVSRVLLYEAFWPEVRSGTLTMLNYFELQLMSDYRDANVDVYLASPSRNLKLYLLP